MNRFKKYSLVTAGLVKFISPFLEGDSSISVLYQPEDIFKPRKICTNLYS